MENRLMLYERPDLRGLYFDEPVMPPSPLTNLLCKHMVVKPGEVAVDLGCGCGALALRAAELGAKVIYAVELNIRGVGATHNASIDAGMEDRIIPILGDMSRWELSALPLPDVLICNPPQLPSGSKVDQGAEVAGAYAAGSDGRRFLDGVISMASRRFQSRGGRLELVTTSVVGIDDTFGALRRHGFSYRITGEAKAEFRSAYYKVLENLYPDSYEMEAGRGFEYLFAISAEMLP